MVDNFLNFKIANIVPAVTATTKTAQTRYFSSITNDISMSIHSLKSNSLATITVYVAKKF